MPSGYSTSPFELIEDLWFEDGDIRVCARRFDSGALCLYNLHRDLIAANSTTLINLLDKCLARRHIYVEGTPYAYLADEDALDLERFFIAICYPTYFFFCKHNSRCFRTALPVFKIALKYKASYVIEALASQLEQDWPQTLEEWDAAQGKDGPFVDPFEDFASDRQTQNRTAPVAVTEPASAIQVARIANLPGILSIAYYQLSRVSHSSVGWQNIVSLVDAKDHRREKKGSVRDHGRGRWDEWSLLSKGDLRRLAVGKEGLAKHMHCFQRHLPQELVLHPSCAKGWSMCVPMKSEDPLAHLLELCSEEVLPDGNTICSDCRSLINKRGREERERVWALLSQLFCTPGYPGMS